MSPLQRIVRNSVFLYGGEVLSRGAAAALVLALARGLGAAATGKYIFVSSLAGIGMIAIDYGPTQYFIRASVQATSHDVRDLVLRVLVVRFLIALVFTVGIFIYALTGVADGEIRALLILAALSLPPLSFAGTIAGVLRARETMGFEAVNRALVAVVTLVLGAAFVLRGGGVVWIGAAMLAASVLSMFYYLVAPRGVLRLVAIRPVGLGRLLPVIVGTWPFLLVSLLSVIYLRLDTVIVQQLLGSAAVGEYGVGLRVMEVFLFVPLVLGSAVFPAIARGIAADPVRTSRAAIEACRVLALVIIPLALIGSTTGSVVIPLVFGRGFARAGMAFSILVWAVVPMSLSIVTTSLISASRQPMANSYLYAGMILFNAVANIAVLRNWGIEGAATVRVATEIIGLIAAWIFVAKRVAAFNLAQSAARLALITGVSLVPFFVLNGGLLGVVVFLGAYLVLHLSLGNQAGQDRSRLLALVRGAPASSPK